MAMQRGGRGRCELEPVTSFRRGWYSGGTCMMYVLSNNAQSGNRFLIFEPYQNPVQRDTVPTLDYGFQWRRVKFGERVTVEGWGER